MTATPGAQPKLGVLGALVVLRADQDAPQGLVRQRYALGWAGRPAGEHLDRNAWRVGTVGVGTVDVTGALADPDRTQAFAADPAHPIRAGGKCLQVVTGSGDRADPQAGQIAAHPFDAATGVHRHHARAGADEADEQADVLRAITQQQRHPLARLHRRRQKACRSGDVGPGGPLTLELHRRRRGVERQDLPDALGQRLRSRR